MVGNMLVLDMQRDQVVHKRQMEIESFGLEHLDMVGLCRFVLVHRLELVDRQIVVVKVGMEFVEEDIVLLATKRQYRNG